MCCWLCEICNHWSQREWQEKFEVDFGKSCVMVSALKLKKNLNPLILETQVTVVEIDTIHLTSVERAFLSVYTQIRLAFKKCLSTLIIIGNTSGDETRI